MSSEFTLLCHLLNKFCRKKLIEKFETAESLDAVVDKEKNNQDLKFKLTMNPKIEPWLKVIGKKPEAGHSHSSIRASFKLENNK